MRKIISFALASLVFAALVCPAFAGYYENVYEESAFMWTDIVKCNYYRADWPYMIGLDCRGRMHATNPATDFYDGDFIREIRSLTNVKDYYIAYCYSNLYFAAVKNDGTVCVCTTDDAPNEDELRILYEAQKLKNVKSLTFLRDVTGGEQQSLLAVHYDGTVSVCGDKLDQDISNWRDIVDVCTFHTGNVIGIKKDGTCVPAGEAFRWDKPDQYKHLGYPEVWTDVDSICVASCPWATELFILRNDGTVLHNNDREKILYDIKSLYFDRESYHMFALSKDGICYMYCSDGCEAPRRWNIKSVGVHGLALTYDSEVLAYSSEYNFEFEVFSDFGNVPIKNIELRSIIGEYQTGEYFCLGEDGRIYRLKVYK